MRGARVVGLLSFQTGVFVSGGSPGKMHRGSAKRDGPCSHLSVGSCAQQAATGVTHQLCFLTRQHMWRHTHNKQDT